MPNSPIHPLSFKDSVVLVTGATGQLGTGICRAFVDAGATVIGWDKTLNSSVHIDGVEYAEVDITDKQAISAAMADIFERHGACDVLVNNAGVSCFEPFEERPESSIDWVMDVNLKGTLFCIQSYVDQFDTRKKNIGSIINVASMYGVVSPDFRLYGDGDRRNSEIYGATKAGVIQMTRYFAVHLAGRGVRVNAISPGGIFNPESPQDSDFVKRYAERCPMGRMAETEEITGSVLFLASPAATYITGHNLVIDGGMTCW